MEESNTDQLSFTLKLAIAFLSLLENSVVTLVYPILPFMVHHYLSPNADENSISQYSGYLEATYRLSQFFACIWVSILSDKVGRRKVLIFCTSIHILASVSLAFSSTYTQAFINRTIAGLCAGSTPVTKSILREITSDKNISQLYGVFALGVGLANITGPLFSMTSNLGKSLPSLFGDIPFFINYPYSVPLLLHGLLAVSTLLVVILYLKEPHKLIEEKKEPISSLLSNKQYLTTVFIYWLVGFVQFAFRLVFSLICRSPENMGGMGIEYEYQVSLVQLAAGVFLVFLPAYLTPRLSLKFGLINSLAGLCAALGPVFLGLGLFAFFPLYVKLTGLTLVFLLGNLFISVAIFYISICISNTVSQSILATANGFSQALVGISRFASTSAFGVIFGWSVSSGLGVAGVDAKFSCFLLCLIPIFDAVFLKFAVDPSVEHKKKNENSLQMTLIPKKVEIKTNI